MDDGQSYAKRLEEALEAKRSQLDREDLPKLKEQIKLFQTAAQGIYNVLDKKGIIHEDPYQYELKISEVVNPPEGPFSESEKIDQMSIRLSQFLAYLDFLNNYYQFSVDYLTLGRIKRILGLVKYFNFAQFSETSSSLNTSCLAEMVGMVRKGSDQLSAGILGDALGQLERSTKDILSGLKDLTAWHREAYKLETRQLVLPGLSFDPTYVITHREEAVKQIRKKYAELASERSFYPELIEELLMEDYSSEGPSLRDEALRKLAVREGKKSEKTQAKSYRGVLLEGIRILAGINYQLDDAITKLTEASAVLETRNQSFGAKLRRAIRKIFSPGDEGIKYEIELLDAVTSERSSELLDFAAFLEEAGRKSRALAALLQRSGPGWKRLESAPEDQAFKFLERNMEEVQRVVKRMAALDEFFKSSVPPEDRSRIRGLKSELTTIKGALIKAKQKKHEYVAAQEEEQQMRRLGIKGD